MSWMKTFDRGNYLFEHLNDINPFRKKIHLLGHNGRDVSRSGFLNLLDSYSMVHLNYSIKIFVGMKCVRQICTLAEAVRVFNMSASSEKSRVRVWIRRKESLVRDVTVINHKNSATSSISNLLHEETWTRHAILETFRNYSKFILVRKAQTSFLWCIHEYCQVQVSSW